MSYTVAVALPPIPGHDAGAWEPLPAAIDGPGSTPAVFRNLRERLTARYPAVDTLDDEEVDGAAWTDGPLHHDLTHQAAVIGIASPRVEEALPFLIETANALGCAVFDWQSGMIHRPGMSPSRDAPPRPMRQKAVGWLRQRIARWTR